MMGEAKRCFAVRTLSEDDRQRHIAAAKERMANGRVGFAPDFGEAAVRAGALGKTLFVHGIRFVSMVRQDDAIELNGITWTSFGAPEDAKYIITVATQQSEANLLSLLATAEPDEILVKGVLDTETMTGDSGEVFRRVLGEVVAL
jgi:hypothetical protein